MANPSQTADYPALAAERFQEYIPRLRFVTCGNVDDGKSTLIGRLLYDSNVLFEDQLSALASDSAKFGTQGDQLDFALLLDGLSAEREQGITIDVAYRYFATPKRRFIVADAPGHEQYTCNTIVGASTADVAVILIDARKGMTLQTRRHSYLAALVGITNFALVVNKLDLVDWSEAVFTKIVREYQVFAEKLGAIEVTAIPTSAIDGHNVTRPGLNSPWYSGPSLIEYLENVEINTLKETGPFRLPVQWVNRPNPDFRGFSGTVMGGSVHIGTEVLVLPSKKRSSVARIVTLDGELKQAIPGQAVTITLADEVDVSRGDLLCCVDNPAEVADQFKATLVWMDREPMHVGRSYLLKSGPTTIPFRVTHLDYKLKIESLEHVAASTLELNEIGVCNLTIDRPHAFDRYTDNRDLGSFIVIDRITNATAGAGIVKFALRRAKSIQRQTLLVDKIARSNMNGHRGGIVWFTGLSGSGKSTIATLTERALHELGVRTFVLDGDDVRRGISKDLGFTDADRIENIRRVAEIAKLMVDAGLVVIVSLISPFIEDRLSARRLVEKDEFFEVFIDTPLAVAESRDPKGLYKKARLGDLPNFTGIDSPYEPPTNPELQIDTTSTSPEEASLQILDLLRFQGIL